MLAIGIVYQQTIGWIRYGYVLVPVALIIWFGLRPNLELRRLAAVLVFSLAALVFWAVFEQAGSTIALFGDQLTDRTLPNNGVFNILGWKVDVGSPFPSAWFQSVNSLFVMTLAPVFAVLWIKLGDRQPSSPAKFAIGLVCLGASFLLMVPAARLTVEQVARHDLEVVVGRMGEGALSVAVAERPDA